MTSNIPTIEHAAKVGPYTLISLLGQGGHAQVWLAQGQGDVRVALKILPIDATEAAKAGLALEYEATHDLHHPAIASALAHGHDAGRDWLALPWIDGVHLEALVESWRPALTPQERFDEAERITRILCEALSVIHEHGFLHRDIKPTNILIDRAGRPFLIDFGLAARMGPNGTAPGDEVMGTATFMAPEVIAQEPIDRRADLYGIGAILYLMLTLRRPIEADSTAGYLALHLTTKPVPPHELVPSVPYRLESIALRLLEKLPARRFPNAESVLLELEAMEPLTAPYYGRDALIAHWLDILKAGQSCGFLVCGPEGSGVRRTLSLLSELVPEDIRATTNVLTIPFIDQTFEHPTYAVERKDLVQSIVLAGSRTGISPFPPTLPCIFEHLQPLPLRALTRMLRERDVPTEVAQAIAHRLDRLGLGWPGTLIKQFDAMLQDGWLVDTGHGLQATRPLRAFESDDLPMLADEAVQAQQKLAQLEPGPLELLGRLAVFARPVSSILLARTSSRPTLVPSWLDELVRGGWAIVHPEDDDLTLELARPGFGALICSSMSPSERQEHHLAIARALGRRRAYTSPETAFHLAQAGAFAEALPLLLACIAHAQHTDRPSEAVEIAQKTQALALTQDASVQALVQIGQALGESLLADGQWLQALATLEGACLDAEAIHDRALSGSVEVALGRAYYRTQRLEQAETILARALGRPELPPEDRSSAWRILADIYLFSGRAESALELARGHANAPYTTGQADEDARTLRALAHPLAVLGRLEEADQALQQADDRLSQGGDLRILAGIRVRRLELALVAGRFLDAEQGARGLIDWCNLHNLTHRMPEAFAIAALAVLAQGRSKEAITLADRVFTAVQAAYVTNTTTAILVALRVLDSADCDATDPLEALLQRTPQNAALFRARSAVDAIAARILARGDLARARTFFDTALQAPDATWAIADVAKAMDLARASARLDVRELGIAAVRRVIPRLPAQGAEGARHELYYALALCGVPPDAQALEARDRLFTKLPVQVQRVILRRWERALSA